MRALRLAADVALAGAIGAAALGVIRWVRHNRRHKAD